MTSDAPLPGATPSDPTPSTTDTPHPDSLTTDFVHSGGSRVVRDRLAAVRGAMAREGVDALVLRPSPDFRFLGGRGASFLVVTTGRGGRDRRSRAVRARGRAAGGRRPGDAGA